MNRGGSFCLAKLVAVSFFAVFAISGSFAFGYDVANSYKSIQAEKNPFRGYDQLPPFPYPLKIVYEAVSKTAKTSESDDGQTQNLFRSLTRQSLYLFQQIYPDFQLRPNFVAHFQIVSPQRLIELARLPSETESVLAYSDNNTGIMNISTRLNLSLAHNQSIIVHELIHRFQRLQQGNIELSCELSVTNETEARMIQDLWLSIFDEGNNNPTRHSRSRPEPCKRRSITAQVY